MADIVDQQTRSRMMAGIRGKDTIPERSLRRELHAQGFRYRLHVKDLPGRPDLVLPKHRAVVFVHGCFWHRHEGCRFSTTPATRADFWRTKFVANVSRDNAIRVALLRADWRVATVWECALRKREQIEMTTGRLAMWLRTDLEQFEIGERDLGKGPITSSP